MVTNSDLNAHDLNDRGRLGVCLWVGGGRMSGVLLDILLFHFLFFKDFMCFLTDRDHK